MTNASNLLKMISEAEGLKVGDTVKFIASSPYADMVGQIANIQPSGKVDVMIGKSIRVDIDPADLDLVSNPDNVGAPKGENFSHRKGKNEVKYIDGSAYDDEIHDQFKSSPEGKEYTQAHDKIKQIQKKIIDMQKQVTDLREKATKIRKEYFGEE